MMTNTTKDTIIGRPRRVRGAWKDFLGIIFEPHAVAPLRINLDKGWGGVEGASFLKIRRREDAVRGGGAEWVGQGHACAWEPGE